VRPIEADGWAILGEIRHEGEPVSPWAVLIRVKDDLIVQSHSYLSEKELLHEVGLLP
jgi:hypothetical protein